MQPFIIAELSANHNHDIEIAKESIKKIADIGASAVKLQTYTAQCITLPVRNEFFRIDSGLWEGYYYYDLYEKASTPWEWHEELFDLARSLGLVCFSSPFSTRGVEFLESIGNPIYKVASFEVMHTQLLEAIAKTRKPVILSLGVASELELDSALSILRHNEKITLLVCTSEYPALLEDARLDRLVHLQSRFKHMPHVDVGISDHTLDSTACIIATTLGASTIEKHFILDKSMPSPDRAFSLDPGEFEEMIRTVHRSVSAIEGISIRAHLESRPYQYREITLDDIKRDEKVHRKGRQYARSLFARRDINQGEALSLENVACVRPSLGMSPLYLDFVIGKRARAAIIAGHPLRLEHVEM